jgi:adenosylcobyric acid synthase
LAEAPVLLIADIDRGGSLAAVVGTLELLDADERGLVKGIIFNKFRGNLALFAPALKFIEQKTGKPVVGVIPFLDRMDIDDEDSVSLEDKQVAINREIEIAVLRLPHISNFTDFAALSQEADVSLRYVRPGQKLGKPDLVILPGSKNTLEDMHYLVQQGYDKAIRRLVAQQVPVIGICGGYQLLGKSICDPQQVESGVGIVAGLGLIDAATIFVAEKVTQQVVATCAKLSFLEMDFSADELTGYEIHMGVTEVTGPGQPAFTVINRSNMELSQADGFVRPDGLVMGTYLHGIFDNDGFRRRLVNILRQRKGLAWVDGKSTAGRKEKQYNRLADHVRQHLNMEQIYQMLKMKL